MSRRKRTTRTITLAGGPYDQRVVQVPLGADAWVELDDTTGEYHTYTGEPGAGLGTFPYTGVYQEIRTDEGMPVAYVTRTDPTADITPDQVKTARTIWAAPVGTEPPRTTEDWIRLNGLRAADLNVDGLS